MIPAVLSGSTSAGAVEGMPVPQLTPNTQQRLMLPDAALQRASLRCTQHTAALQASQQPGQRCAAPNPSPSSCSARAFATPMNAASTEWRTLQCPCTPGRTEACPPGSGDTPFPGTLTMWPSPAGSPLFALVTPMNAATTEWRTLRCPRAPKGVEMYAHDSGETPFPATLTVWSSPASSPLGSSPSLVAFGAPPAASMASEVRMPSAGATITPWHRSTSCQWNYPVASSEASPPALGGPPTSSSPGTFTGPVMLDPWASPRGDMRTVCVPFSRGLLARQLPLNSSQSATPSGATGVLAGCPRPSPEGTSTLVAKPSTEEIAERAPPTTASTAQSPFHMPPPAKPAAQDTPRDGSVASREASCSPTCGGVPSWRAKLGA
mmetsp:Transcript_143400/g.357278  ORF Transcript_143400/g.357278 Transcript_143400/m.357278 type:complete len:378 (-) Transcript_143400:97-1230(-)